ncbi:MAG: hypothetical protein IKN72_10580 [Clostridia bacterium]|nr:hypothetical protein [Clostridia bacterium]
MDSTIRDGNFNFGDPQKEKDHPTNFSIPKVLNYMKKSGKKFDELTKEELEKCK